MKPSSFKTVFLLLLVLCAPTLVHSGAPQRALAPTSHAAAGFALAGQRPFSPGEATAGVPAPALGNTALWVHTTTADSTLFNK